MKNSGIMWIGEIPDDWEVIKTKNVFRNVKRIVGEQHWDCERLALTLNGVIKRNKDEADGLQPEKFDTYQFLYKNELVFKLIDLGNIATSRVGLSPFDGMVSPAYIILHNDCSDNRFYYYYYLSMWHRNIFNSLGDNGVRSSIGANDLLNLPIVDTNEAERIKIADFLDKKCAEIDRLIAHEEAMIDELKAYKQSVITEAVTKGLDRTAPMKDSGVEWIGEIPAEANVTKVAFLYNIVLGKMITPNKSNGCDELLDYFCAANVHFDGIDYFGLKKMWFSQTEKEAFAVYKGDLLVVEGGAGAGGAHIVEESIENCYMQNSIMAVRPIGELSNKWVYYTLYSLVKANYIEFVCNKATIPHFTKDKLGNTPIVVFGRNVADKIIDYLDAFCTKINSIISLKQEKIEVLRDYKKSLIYEYVTGKKEVV